MPLVDVKATAMVEPRFTCRIFVSSASVIVKVAGWASGDLSETGGDGVGAAGLGLGEDGPRGGSGDSGGAADGVGIVGFGLAEGSLAGIGATLGGMLGGIDDTPKAASPDALGAAVVGADGRDEVFTASVAELAAAPPPQLINASNRNTTAPGSVQCL